MLVSLIVPAYGEGATLEEVLRQAEAQPFEKEIIVVDDGSTDETPELLRRLLSGRDVNGLRVVTHPVNRGKGAAVRSGIAQSRGDIVVIQDADLEYQPSDLPRLLAPLFERRADVVYGTRLRGGPEPQRAHLFWHYVGNRFLSLVTNVLYNTTISDMEVGYKAFRGDLIRALELTSEDFRIEAEVTAKLLRRGRELRLYEVPVSYYGRSYAEGKKITWRDGLGAFATLVRYRVSG
jgi:glycosyltransferase involved in cell wall biosynthesis